MFGLLGCANTPTQPQSGSSSPAIEVPGAIPRVTLEESKAAFDNNAAVFLDVRSESSFAVSHIPGALSIPLADLEARLAELDPNLWIITYCT
jgi:ArsR family transcriptional regulator